MKRNPIALCLLLVSLFGLAPAAFACASRNAGDACCPTGKHPPCEPQSLPSALLRETSCCSAQSPATAVVSLSPAHKYRPAQAGPAPLDPPLAGPAATIAGAINSVPLPDGVHEIFRCDQSQLYLLTGRLRL